MEDYYEYLDSNGVTTLYKLIKDDTIALIDSYSVTVNGITTTLDTHINDSDIHTPISVIEGMIDTKISGLVNSAPATLDTLKELSDALGNDPNFATTVANQIGNKASKDSVYTKEETNTLLEDKANSVHSHVVSDITDFPTIPTKTSDLINDSGFLTSSDGLITSVSWSDINDKPNFSTVATSGSYTDLSNTPTIPTKVSQLENDMGFGTGGDTSNYVHKTGDETIDGNKFFIQDVNVKNSDVDIAVTPSNNLFSCFKFRGKGNVTAASIQYSQRTYGVNDICFYLSDASSNSHGFRIRTDNRLEPIENNTYSLGSASNKWAKVYSDDVVHTSGNETIAGNKTFTNQLYLGAGGSNYGQISSKDNNSILRLFGGTNASTGANLDLYGEGLSSGGFSLRARTSDKIVGLDGKVDGTLKWNGKNVAIDENLVHRSGDETIVGNKTFSSKIVGNLQGNADTATKASYLDNYSAPGMNKIYLDWDKQVEGYVGLKVDNTIMGGLITTKNIGSQSVSSATYATTQATSDNSTKIATTAWVRTYVDSVAGSNTVGSSVSAYWSNSSNVTATGQTSASGIYPACYSEYITKTPTVGTIYSGAQLYTELNAYASAKGTVQSSGQYSTHITSVTAQATFSNPISSTGKYLCTTANTVRFRGYAPGGNSVGTASVVENSSTKSIFIRVE